MKGSVERIEEIRVEQERIRRVLTCAETGKLFKVIAYRGVSERTPVDEGMYGKGTYFTFE
jgi:hypothetical protein